MELNLYDFDGNHLSSSDRIISFYADEKFCSIGNGEIHLENDDAIAEILADTPCLILENDDGYQCITVGFTLSKDDFTVFTRPLSWLLSKMIVPPISISGKTPDKIAEDLLSAAHGSNIYLGNSAAFDTAKDFNSDCAQTLSDALSLCLSENGGGFSVRFSHSDKKLYLDILKGSDLDVYVSENDETLSSLSIEFDILDKASDVCYLQSLSPESVWNVDQNSPTLYNGRSGNFGKCYRVKTSAKSFERFDIDFEHGDYIYCNTRDGKWKKSLSKPNDFYVFPIGSENGASSTGGSSSTGSTGGSSSENRALYWLVQSREKSEDAAKASLCENTEKRDYFAEAKNIKLNRDYLLGDTVRLQYSLCGKTKSIKCRISETEFFAENGEYTEKPKLSRIS